MPLRLPWYRKDRAEDITKAFGGNEPPAMQEAATGPSQMTMDHAFAPGEPVGPYDGYSRTPRQFDFTTGYNIATRPRSHERVSFDVLRGLIESYDVAQVCCHHRIDSIRSLDWKLIASDGFSGDATGAIAAGMAVLAKPDRVNSFSTWLSKYLYDVLAYDAGTLFRLRNRAGRVIGLSVPDGTSFAPLLDYWGGSPEAPAEAYVQYVNGLPWNWLTRDDLIYEPFRPRTNSPYGHAPLESIMLNANTDIRFQIYFLERFTEGNVPEAFASAPEGWSPDQIEQFQEFWDSIMMGEQSRKHQIRWMPGGSTLAWSNEKDFTDAFSLFLMRKTAAAFHVVPADLGFTETVNLSSSESQADVQHRVGDLPLGRHVEGILTRFLQGDLGLPLKFAFDWGEEQDDRLAQAQADDVYVKIGVIGPSELREMRFGLPEPDGNPIPRFIFTTRAGPIPLSSLVDVAGPVDGETGAPVPGAILPHKEFLPVEGVVPVPPPHAPALAERIYGPEAIPPAPPTAATAQPVVKEGEGGAAGGTIGITSETGITSYDGPGEDDEDDIAQAVLAELAKSELAAFRRFERARKRSGQWRDFAFETVGTVRGHNLNDEGRLAVRKAAGEVAVAGLAVQAADTGRVLMLQRALDPDDPAGGTWEFPGGHLDQGETPLLAAWREFAEETGCIPPPGRETGSWGSTDGVYQGIVWTVDVEASVPVRTETQITNPDDPDGDQVESIAWWSPDQLPGNPAVRPELLATIAAVMDALGCAPAACCGAECCAGGCCNGAAGCQCGPPGDDVAKAGGAAPKGREWPGLPEGIRAAIIRRRERLLRKHLNAVVAAWDACMAELHPRDLVRGFREDVGLVTKAADPEATWRKESATAAAAAWLGGIYATDGYPALAAALEDAVAGGTAEGEADALAAAADRQGVSGFVIGTAFSAALVRAQGDPGVSQQAQETAEKIIGGAAADIGRTLAAMAEDGGGEGEMAGAVSDVTSGSQSRSLNSWLPDAVWAAMGAGALALYSQASQGDSTVMTDWITDGNPCAACQDNEAGSPYAPEDVPSYPQHPRCQCTLSTDSDIPSSFFAGLLS